MVRIHDKRATGSSYRPNGASAVQLATEQSCCCGSSRYSSVATLNPMPEERIKLALTGNRTAFRREKGSNGPNISNPYHPPRADTNERADVLLTNHAGPLYEVTIRLCQQQSPCHRTPPH